MNTMRVPITRIWYNGLIQVHEIKGSLAGRLYTRGGGGGGGD